MACSLGNRRRKPMAVARRKTTKKAKKAVKKTRKTALRAKATRKKVAAKRPAKKAVKRPAKKAVKKAVKKAPAKKVVKKAAPAPKPAAAMAMPKPMAPSTGAPVAAPPRIKAWHVVTSADTPSSITQKYYGTSDPAKWSAVYEVNKTVIGTDMNQLNPALPLRTPEA